LSAILAFRHFKDRGIEKEKVLDIRTQEVPKPEIPFREKAAVMLRPCADEISRLLHACAGGVSRRTCGSNMEIPVGNQRSHFGSRRFLNDPAWTSTRGLGGGGSVYTKSGIRA
jgi:hypothetical protein